ncbi:hypothetical protein TIFTF001_015429 [Ficus carica]|uniref:Uncharacterized protein n=1 Tax=Ficus carica TaxID=3494 RepID=A0AA88D7V2_FICCA|nr:hypothetical protein TIFTF001_015429 [Ficus carica]
MGEGGGGDGVCRAAGSGLVGEGGRGDMGFFDGEAWWRGGMNFGDGEGRGWGGNEFSDGEEAGLASPEIKAIAKGRERGGRREFWENLEEREN